MNIKLKTRVLYTPKQVWEVVSQTALMPGWNPNFLSLQGKLSLGEHFRAVVLRNSGQALVLRGRIVRLEPWRNITWQSLGWFALWSKHEHQIKIMPHREGYTEIIQLSRFKGLILRSMKPEHVAELQRQMHIAQNGLINRLDDLYEPEKILGAAPRVSVRPK